MRLSTPCRWPIQCRAIGMSLMYKFVILTSNHIVLTLPLPNPPSSPFPWQWLSDISPLMCLTCCGSGQETGTHSEPQKQLLLGDRIVKFIGWMGGFYSRKSVSASGQLTVCGSVPAVSMYMYMLQSSHSNV